MARGVSFRGDDLSVIFHRAAAAPRKARGDKTNPMLLTQNSPRCSPQPAALTRLGRPGLTGDLHCPGGPKSGR